MDEILKSFKSEKKNRQSDWKGFERRIAKIFGGKRSLRGDDFSKSDSDILHDKLIIECKYRKTIDRKEIDKQLEGYAKRVINKRKLPISVFTIPGSRRTFVRLQMKYLRPMLIFYNYIVNDGVGIEEGLGESILDVKSDIVLDKYVEIELKDFSVLWQTLEKYW